MFCTVAARSLPVFVLSICLLVSTAGRVAAESAPVVADTVYRNGFVYTADGPRSRAQAFAVRGGKFLAVGSNEDVKAVTGKGTEVVNLKGRMVMPGLIDTHIHALRGASTSLGVVFDATASVDQIKAVLRGHTVYERP